MFYTLNAKIEHSQVVLTFDADTVNEYESRWFRGTVRPAKLPIASVYSGNTMPDVLETSFVSPLVTYRFLSTLISSDARSWSAYPVRVLECPKGCEVHFALCVTGRCGPIDNTRSVMKRVTRVGSTSFADVRGPLPVGLFFTQSTWDGSDIFAPEGTQFIFVTARLKAFLEAEGLGGLEFVPQEEELNVALLGKPADDLPLG